MLGYYLGLIVVETAGGKVGHYRRNGGDGNAKGKMGEGAGKKRERGRTEK